MANYTENSIKVNISATKVWNVLKEYSNIEQYASTITSSPIVNSINSGLGAKRKCTFTDGTSLVEEIIEFKDGKSFKMNISEFSLPLKSMNPEMGVKEIDENTSEIFMNAEFVVKGGPFGWLMGQFIIRPVMKGVFKKVMSGLAYHCETGKRIDEKLPEQKELATIIIS